MKKSNTLRAIVAVTLVFALITFTCFAIEPNGEASSATGQTEYYFVESGELNTITEDMYLQASNVQTRSSFEGKPIALSVTTEQHHDGIGTSITFAGIDKIGSEVDRIAVADRVLSLMGYPDFRIQELDTSIKLEYISKDDLHATTTYAVPTDDGTLQFYPDYETALSALSSEPDYVTNERGVLISTLSYTTISSNRWMVYLDSCYQGPAPAGSVPLRYYPSIAAQLCHIRPTEYGMMRYQKNGTLMSPIEFDTNDFETFGDSLAGHGRVLPVELPLSTNTNVFSNVQVYIRAEVQNSGVAPGGSFGIYGNFGTTSIALTNVSFSYPWGISASFGVSPVHLKTELTAYYYG